MTTDEATLEEEIVRKGKTAPRLTPAKIDEQIVAIQFYIFPGTTLTVCALTLKNGFVVTGESAAASPENFDKEIGASIAQKNARDKIWALEGYALRNALSGRAPFNEALRQADPTLDIMLIRLTHTNAESH